MRPPSSEPHPSDLEKFITYLWLPDDIVEIRTIGGARPHQRWVRAHELEAIATDLARLNAQGANIYAGVAPRSRHNGGTAKDVACVRVVYADLDHCTIEEARERLSQSGLPQPGLIISSGNGVHTYWRLETQVTGDDLASVPALIASIAVALNGDKKVKDLPRIMRMPGFNNVKDRANPKPCFIVECHPAVTVTVDQLLDCLRIGQPVPLGDANHPSVPGKDPGATPQISHRTAEFLDHGAPDGERNPSLFAAACDLWGCGWDESKARDALLKAAAKCGLPTDEAETTIRSAFSKPRTPSRSNVPAPSGLPEIVCNGRQVRETIADAWNVLRQREAANPRFFIRSQRLVHVIGSDGPRPYIEFVSEGVMFGILLRMADWITNSDQGKKHPVMPQPRISHDMLTNPHWLVPELRAVVVAPTFASDGTLVCKAGYSKDHHIFLSRRGAEALRISFTGPPTPAEVRDAVDLLLTEWLGDFPFASQADRANAIAALILPLVRLMIDGPTPLHAFIAPAAGTGKSLLCDLFGIVTTGRSIEVRPMPSTDDEMRKRITSELIRGWPIIAFDNVRANTVVDSASFAGALTSVNWSDRELGASRMVVIPNQATWYLTGNNTTFSQELARRQIEIRLDAGVERPAGREGFRLPNIRTWTADNRSRLFNALVTLVRNWIDKGSPPFRIAFGSFEDWSGVVGGILETGGITGFLGNLDTARGRADAESREFGAFVLLWWDNFGSAPVRPSQLEELCEANDLLRTERGDKGPRSRVTRLGSAVSRRIGSIVAGFRIDQCGGRKGNEYVLTPIDGEQVTPKLPYLPNVCRTSDSQGSAPEVLVKEGVMEDCRTCHTLEATDGSNRLPDEVEVPSTEPPGSEPPSAFKVRQVRQNDEIATKQGDFAAEPSATEVRQSPAEVRHADRCAYGEPT